jgi:flagellin
MDAASSFNERHGEATHMSSRINTNVDAFTAERNLSMTGTAYSKSVQKLSSGLRINSAADDAAGLAISEKLRAQIRGLAQAQRNSQDGISMIQTGEGALNETTSMLQRMRELAVQASNDTLSTSDRASINTELQQLAAEINGTSDRTTFNGKVLLKGALQTSIDTTGTAKVGNVLSATGGNATVAAISVSSAQAGHTFTFSSSAAGTLTLTRSGDNVAQTINVAAVAANGSESLNFSQLGVNVTLSSDASGKTQAGVVADVGTAGLTVKTLSAATSASANIQVGANGTDNMSVAFNQVYLNGATGVSAMDNLNTSLSTFNTDALGSGVTVADANDLITKVDGAIDYVNTTRANLGAYQNRLEHTISNLGVAQENLTASESRIRDVDMAAEMVNFTKTGILQQAGQAILAQANSAPSGIISLLRG